jgi:uncharacterized phage protein gp47/JayE
MADPTLPIATLDEIHEQLIADYQNRFPGVDMSRFQDEWKRTRTTSLAASHLQWLAESVLREAFPDTAQLTLDRHGSIRNVIRTAATVAYKADALRLVGTAAATFALGTQMAHKDGTIYALDEGGVIPAIGYIDVDIRSVTTGSVARKQKGEILTFLTAPVGLQSNAELQLDIDQGGDDVEKNDPYRARVLDRIAFPGMGGNRNDYEEWMLSQAGVTTAYVYPLRQGLGSVDMAFLHGGRGASRIPTAPEIASVQAYIDTVRPISVAQCRILTVVAEPNDVEMLVVPFDEVQWRFDWDDTIPLVVSAWTAATRVLKFTTARAPDMDVKDRLIYKATVVPNDGAELVIEALGPGADEVVVRTLTAAQLLAPPVAGNLVYGGGPLVEPARQAILTYIDALGPGRGSYASGSWEDRLSLNRLAGAVEPLAGVFDTTVLVPAANVAPANLHPAATIGLITPRQIIVRRGA